MKIKKFRYFACDFETTVYEGQTHTEVWSACFAELFQDTPPIVLGSISSMFQYFISLKTNCCLYFHNLKFDGAFWLDYLIRNGWKFNRVKESDMLDHEFKCSISDMGNFYNIIIKAGSSIIEIRDSLKLLPFSLNAIGESFKTQHKKLEMEYTGYRYENCPITSEELEYIKNDVLVLKEALEIMFEEGHDKITIGSCCLAEFKKLFDKDEYEKLFPNLYKISIPYAQYGSSNVGDYIRNSYRGGWCYLNPKFANRVIGPGHTNDVNSLYPSSMHSESGNYYPVGLPRFFSGKIPDDIDNYKYFVRIKCRFKLREGFLPTVQIKRNLLYKGNEYLTTSDIYYEGDYHRKYIGIDGVEKEASVTMTMTDIDYETFLRHYYVYDLQILDGCYFCKEKGIFDRYIDYYKELKITSTGARKSQAKLFLNNLYGKFASSPDSSYKVPFLDGEKDCIRFDVVEEYEKEPGYIPIGSFITSYSRNFTIAAAQANYENFIYSDTDSIHVLGTESKGIKEHESAFCCWKRECDWDEGIFVRQKTYIEHVVKENRKEVEPHYDIKCAGMPARCKEQFLKHHNLTDFKIGLVLEGKLRPKRIKGGIVLVNTTYEMK